MRTVVIRLNREPHPNADKMFIQKIDDEHVVCGNIQAWEGKELAVHIPPDTVVDTDRPEFSWLKAPGIFTPASEGDTRYHKVQSVTRRSVLSYGLMVEAPEGVNEGDDVTGLLGVR